MGYVLEYGILVGGGWWATCAVDVNLLGPTLCCLHPPGARGVPAVMCNTALPALSLKHDGLNKTLML